MGHSASHVQFSPVPSRAAGFVGCTHRDNMRLDFGLQGPRTCHKRNNRWLFQIEGISAVANALPPLKGSRPKFEFKEQQIAHLTQSIYYPIKAEWKPVNLTLYDIKKNENPVFNWMQLVYDPTPAAQSEWRPVLASGDSFKRNASLCLYDGCGQVIERWKFENCYPQNINWGDLDMGNSDVVVVDVTLRYDRAYIVTSGVPSPSPVTASVTTDQSSGSITSAGRQTTIITVDAQGRFLREDPYDPPGTADQRQRSVPPVPQQTSVSSVQQTALSGVQPQFRQGVQRVLQEQKVSQQIDADFAARTARQAAEDAKKGS